MILSAAFVIGFSFGWWRARTRGGNTLDKLQYGAAHGIAVAVLALILTIVAGWAGLV